MSLVSVVLTCMLLTYAGDECGTAGQSSSSQQTHSEPAQCFYQRESARFDECNCGTVADGVAARLQLEPPPMVILIDSSATKDERPGLEVKRAQNARDFLVREKGIDPGRIVLRWFREDRASAGRWGGALRFVVLRPGDKAPAFFDGDASRQVSAAILAPN